jgi:RNA polymerase sigma-B factor
VNKSVRAGAPRQAPPSSQALAGHDDHDLVTLVQAEPIGSPSRAMACEALIERYHGLVRSCVQRYRASPEPQEDLMQVGYLGLLKAINNFDPSFGSSLRAYALPCISGEIKRHFRDKRWQVHVRRSAQELRLELREASAVLTQRLARAPQDEELASYLNVSEGEVREALRAGHALQASSLDAPLSGEPDAASLADVLGGEDPEMERLLDIEAVWAHWTDLPEREQRLLALRFFGNMSQSEIGEVLGISQMHVSRLLARALGYLRERLACTGQDTEGQATERAATGGDRQAGSGQPIR